MEPDEMRMYSSSPPPLEDDETGHEEDDEFGDFGGFSGRLSSSLSFTEFTDPHTGLSQPCSMASPLEHFTRSNRIFRPGNLVHDGNSKRPAEQFQPSSYVTTGVDSSQKEFNRQDCISELPVPLTNGFLERVHQETLPDHHATTAPALCNCPQREETGFADFSAFAEPEMQPWCCGFTHTDPTEHSEGREKGTNLTNGFSEDHSDTEQETVMESEPGSKHLAEEGNIDCTRVVQHCEQRDSEPTHQSQDLSLDLSVITTPTEEHNPGSEELVGPEKRVPSPNKQVNLIQAPELEGERERDWEGTEREEEEEEEEEETMSPFPTTVSGSVSEEFASFCEAVSPDGLEDFGDFSETVFALSSMAPQEDVTGDLREKTETKIEDEEEQKKQEEKEKEEDFGNFRNAGSFPSQEFADLEQSESRVQGEEGFADFEQACRVREGGQGDLPPSDSFADFRSAHLDDDAEGQGEKEEAWGAFGDQRTPSERETWAEFGEEKSAKWTDPEEEGEEGGWQGSSAERRDSFQASLTCRLKRLLLASFPAVAVAEVTEEDIMSLGALLEAQDTQPEEGEGEAERQKQREGEQPSHVAHWVPHCIWRQPQDLHNAFGLKFQWGGSHSNITLLHCLGMDTRNILFTGQRKHPVIVPVFAADLGMLEPTKEPLMSASTAGQTAATAQALSGSQVTRTSSKDSTQGGLPSVQFDWSSCGLSNPLDASSVSSYSSGLNLDYFGPVEDCGSNSSSPSTPPPGVDPELYELTTAKLETSDTSSRLADTYNRLMTTMEKTSTTTRKPHRDKELSGEAAKVMSGLPDLSFMLVKVLMFRSTLAPPDTCSMALQ